ncbi:MAG: VWA domain-containing protein [Phycisphaerae bacterium]|nr:VWA domain-containing protein [Phycisphaerae bacterium]
MTNDRHGQNEGREANETPNRTDGGIEASAPPRDELDSLLRAWHDESAVAAAAHRDELLARVAGERTNAGGAPGGAAFARHPVAWRDRLHRIGTAPALRAAAVVAVALVAGAILMLVPSRTASADIGLVQVPEGGRLDAVDRDGNLIGPCPLQHTAVDAQISGFVSRVTVTQKYANTYGRLIEAVYTFPLSHRAAVDRMRMIVRSHGEERIVEGEVKERTLARQIYESARRDGFVASLLEQERPNIFTQSVANIEPGAEVLVEISYVETLPMRDGVFTFDFPMVVGPRYIPGGPPQPPSMGGLPAGLVLRQGVILLAPAQIRLDPDRVRLLAPEQMAAQMTQQQQLKNAAKVGPITAMELLEALQRAVAIERPVRVAAAGAAPPFEQVRADFIVKYPDGSEEPGTLLADGTGEIAGRWFWCPPAPPETKREKNAGTGFARGTDQVPDAALITPMPVRPPERAGHDLSLRISIDTGGPAVTNLRSELHKIDVSEPAQSRAVVTLEKGKTIPNRDFVLSWKLAGGEMAEGVLTQRSPGKDGYFLLYMIPPARVAPETIRARELVFVLDTSGSMNGFPIEKSKEVMTRMLGAMRTGDTFNLITFAGDHHVLWPAPRPATEENLKLARAFVESRQGAGGTEMMKAIDAALKPGDAPNWKSRRRDDPGWVPVNEPTAGAPATSPPPPGAPPTRIVCFLTDGYVGNDMAIVDAVRRYAGTTRVFSFGIGNSVNRFLLSEMARAGRGAAEFVLLPSDAEEVVARFSDRVRTPVLTDISVSFDGVETAHVTPPADAIPDLYDREPLVIAGRYPASGRGSIRVRGMTGQGPWERTIPVDFTDGDGNSSVVAPIWARLQVDDILRPHLNELQNENVPAPIRDMVVRLAEQHRIMSPFTSFVAVEKSRVTVGGRSVLVAVPIELPQGVSWEGNFGSAGEVLKVLRAPPQMMADDEGNEVHLYMAGGLATPLDFDKAPDFKLGMLADTYGFQAPAAATGVFTSNDPAAAGVHTINHPAATEVDRLRLSGLKEGTSSNALATGAAPPASGNEAPAAPNSAAVAAPPPPPPPPPASQPIASPRPPAIVAPAETAGRRLEDKSARDFGRLSKSLADSSRLTQGGATRPSAPSGEKAELRMKFAGKAGQAKPGEVGGEELRRWGGTGAPRPPSRGVSMGTPVVGGGGGGFGGGGGVPIGEPSARAERAGYRFGVAHAGEHKPREREPTSPERTDRSDGAGVAPTDAMTPPAAVSDASLKEVDAQTRGEVEKWLKNDGVGELLDGKAAAAGDAHDLAPNSRVDESPAPSRALRVLDAKAILGIESTPADADPESSKEIDDQYASELQVGIMSAIDPQSWIENGGGAGASRILPAGRIAIVHQPAVLAKVDRFVAALAKIGRSPIGAVTRSEVPMDPRTVSLIDIRSFKAEDGAEFDARCDLLEAATEAIEPETWQQTGGERSTRLIGGVVVTDADSRVAETMRSMFDSLRGMIAAPPPAAPVSIGVGDETIVIWDLRPLVRPSGAESADMELVRRRVEELVERLTTMVDSGEWRSNGGTALLRVLGDEFMIVCAKPDLLAKASQFMKMRAHRAIVDAERGAAADRYSQASLTKLSSRLEASLLIAGLEALAAKEELAQASSSPPDADTPVSAASGSEEPMPVVARFTAVDSALEKSLRSIDATIESHGSVSGVAIVRLPRVRLVDLGLLDATIRVDPMPAQP